jgi:hydroxymethylpyrimidine pyrophosphatase-like HAD family hydrolase
MENATEQVRAVADDIAPENDCGGVGEHLLDLLCQM